MYYHNNVINAYIHVYMYSISFPSENFANRLSYLTELAAAHPALRDSYLTKSQIAAQKFDTITDAAKVKGHLEALKRLMKDIEQQLKDLKESRS